MKSGSRNRDRLTLSFKLKNVLLLLLFLTFSCEEVTGVFAGQGNMFRNRSQKFNNVGKVIFIPRVLFTRVRLEQVVTGSKLKTLCIGKEYSIMYQTNKY